MTNLYEAERAAYCNLLATREEEREARQLEGVIFDAWLAASKASSIARKREAAAFDVWLTTDRTLSDSTKITVLSP